MTLAAERSSLRVGVVGTGALGRHHVRILSGLPAVELVGVFDIAAEVGNRVAAEFDTRAFADLDSLADQIEAAVVAVPTTEHAAVGCLLLERGIDVLVEKPIAQTLVEADRLVQAAQDRVLAVGHVEYFNPAVERLLAIEQRPRSTDWPHSHPGASISMWFSI